MIFPYDWIRWRCVEKKHFGKCKVIECKDLTNEHSLLSKEEHTNPWCGVYKNHDHLVGKTGQKHHTQNPVFDETFEFEFVNDDTLHIHVHHAGSLMNYDLGKASIQLKILKEGDQDLWLGLGNKQGEVHVLLTCHDEN